MKKNIHCRSKEHVSKFSSQVQATREESAFYKHMASQHSGVPKNKRLGDFFKIKVLKAYKKPFTRNVEEET